MNQAFTQLRAIFKTYEPQLKVTSDAPSRYDVYTHKDWNGKPMYFGGVAQRKNYVGFYLMAVYVFPELLNGISPELKKRMQGLSCFNFKAPDEKLFAELTQLTKRCASEFIKRKLM